MVYVPDGTYILTGPLEIGDNTHLQMSAGTTLERNFALTAQGTIQNKDQANGNQNIRVSGGAILAFNSSAFGKHLIFRQVTFLAIENLRILSVYGAEWNTSIIDCEDVTVSGLVIHSGTQIGEDGLHFAGGKRIAITNCIVECGDDALSFTNEPASQVEKELEDVVVSNCYLFSRRANVLRIEVAHTTPTPQKAIRRVRIANIVAKVGDGSGFGSGVTILGPVPGSDLLTDIEIDGLWLDASQSGGGSPVDIDNVKRVRLHRVVVMQPKVRVTIDGSTDVELRDCVVDSPQNTNQQCLLVANAAACSNVRIIGGYYRNAKDHALLFGTASNAVTGFEISNILLEGTPSGPTPTVSGINLINAFDGIVVGNKITGCQFQGVAEQTPSDGNLFIANLLNGNGVIGALQLKGPNSEAIRNVAEAGRKIDDSGGFRQTIDGWNQDNVAANQTNVELLRSAGRFRALRPGSVTGVIVTSTEARTAGTLTVTVYMSSNALAGQVGASIGLSAVLDATNTSRHAVTQPKDIVAAKFLAGYELYMVVSTTSTWTPITADIRCAIEIED